MRDRSLPFMYLLVLFAVVVATTLLHH